MKLSQALLERRTSKLIGDISNPENQNSGVDEIIDSILTEAGNAPFHYPCAKAHQQDLSSPVPWRAYKLNQQACQTLMQKLLDMGDQTKVPNMLAAAEYLVQVTWLPEPGSIASNVPVKEGAQFEGSLRNMEHIAGASAFCQSLLLSVTGYGFRTYWSSGGVLRSPDVFKLLNISDQEILLGSLFLFPQKPEFSEIKPGSMADKRGEITDWSREVKLA